MAPPRLPLTPGGHRGAALGDPASVVDETGLTRLGGGTAIVGRHPIRELGTERLQGAHECCPESLVPLGVTDPHGTQCAMAVAARVRLGLGECPLPASGGCRR